MHRYACFGRVPSISPSCCKVALANLSIHFKMPDGLAVGQTSPGLSWLCRSFLMLCIVGAVRYAHVHVFTGISCQNCSSYKNGALKAVVAGALGSFIVSSITQFRPSRHAVHGCTCFNVLLHQNDLKSRSSRNCCSLILSQPQAK